MRCTLVIVLLLSATPAGAQGFWGGVVEGTENARQNETEQRALEMDRRYGTHSYDRLVEQHRQERIERQTRENADILRRLDQDRFNRQYGPNPRY